MDKSSWIALISAVLLGPLGIALARYLSALAESLGNNNRGQNQMLQGLRDDQDQILAKLKLESVAPKPPPAPRPKSKTLGGSTHPTPLPFFPPKGLADAVPEPIDAEVTASLKRKGPPPIPPQGGH